jgi:nicotinamide-nucleotide amidase
VAFSEEIAAKASRVLELARARGYRLACAESCTGGLVSGAITAVPGSSAVLRGGVVSYAIPIKHEVLGVDNAILDDPALGAVSRECARQMCKGARRLLGCDIAVSVTGIAGPGGEEPQKPVGTVWLGCATRTGTIETLRHFDGDRELVRMQAVEVALSLIREAIVELTRA